MRHYTRGGIRGCGASGRLLGEILNVMYPRARNFVVCVYVANVSLKTVKSVRLRVVQAFDDTGWFRAH